MPFSRVVEGGSRELGQETIIVVAYHFVSQSVTSYRHTRDEAKDLPIFAHEGSTKGSI